MNEMKNNISYRVLGIRLNTWQSIARAKQETQQHTLKRFSNWPPSFCYIKEKSSEKNTNRMLVQFIPKI